MGGVSELTPRLAVVILNYGRPQDTIACAEIVMRGDPFLLVIVDNASRDDSTRLMSRWGRTHKGFCQFEAANPSDAAEKSRQVENDSKDGTKIILIQSPQNGGYAAGNNLGLAAALALGADYVWILNNDAFPEENALQEVKMALAANNNIHAGLWGTIVMQGNSNLVQCIGGGCTNLWSGLSKQLGHGMELDDALKYAIAESARGCLNYICGASVIVSREFVEKVGYLDEGFFLYCEEQDWAIRGKKLGFCICVVSGAVVHHFEGSTTGMNEGSRPVARMVRLALSRLRLAARHRPAAVLTVFMGLLYALMRMYLKNSSLCNRLPLK